MLSHCGEGATCHPLQFSVPSFLLRKKRMGVSGNLPFPGNDIWNGSF